MARRPIDQLQQSFSDYAYRITRLKIVASELEALEVSSYPSAVQALRAKLKKPLELEAVAREFWRLKRAVETVPGLLASGCTHQQAGEQRLANNEYQEALTEFETARAAFDEAVVLTRDLGENAFRGPLEEHLKAVRAQIDNTNVILVSMVSAQVEQGISTMDPHSDHIVLSRRNGGARSATMRVYELARELGVPSSSLLKLCSAEGIGVKRSTSTVTNEEANRLRARVRAEPTTSPASPSSTDVVDPRRQDSSSDGNAAMPQPASAQVYPAPEAEPPVAAAETVMTEPSEQVLHLYAGFAANRDRLLGDLNRLKGIYGAALLANCPPEMNLLDYFIELVFPEGLTQGFFISNTSLKEGLFYLTVRPRIDGPRLEREFPKDLVLSIGGLLRPFGSPSPVMVVEQVVDAVNSPCRPFEIERAAVCYTREGNINPVSQRVRNLLTVDFVSQLPPISIRTRAQLQEWRACLKWKQRVIQSRLAGLRYLTVDMTDDGLLRFLIVAENKAVYDRFRRNLFKDDLKAFELGYSRNEWAFEYNDSHRGKEVNLGDFVRDESLKNLPVKAEGLPWESPFVAYVYFRLNEDAQNEYGDLVGQVEPDAVRERFLRSIHRTGFLALSIIGDRALITRQEKELEQLERQSGYAPFLSSYLFDIKSANCPRELVAIDGNEWLREDLNPAQKDAVRMMISAPDLAMVQGPPGTGKTTMIAEAIYQLVRRGKKVLVASQANLAVDNALERLVQTPTIRAVRLGKKGARDLPFVQENVLRFFYGAIAGKCQTDFLNKWAEIDRGIADTEQWIERYDLLMKDLERCRAAVDELRKEQLSLERQREGGLQRLDAVRAGKKEYEQTQRFLRFLAGDNDDAEFMLPGSLLDVFYDHVVIPLDHLLEVGICLNPNWRVRDAESSGMRSVYAGDILKAWKSLGRDVPSLQGDLDRLRAQTGKSILDPQTATELQQVYKEILELQERMTDDASLFPRYQVLKQKERELKRKGSGLDRVRYELIFNGSVEGRRASDAFTDTSARRHEVVSRLETVIARVKEVARQVEKGLDVVRQAASGIRQEASSESDSEKAMKRCDGELRRVATEAQEASERLKGYQQAMVEHLHSRLGVALDKGEQGLEQAPAIRDVMYSHLEGLRTSHKDQRSFREVWEPLIRAWTGDLNDPGTLKNDQHYVLPMYIRNCNVVGITCTERPNTLKDLGHTKFDVVIIDEVSKATPPELIMPMMLGRTSILVGDHRQLPPLFKEQGGSWEEAVVEADADADDAGEKETELTEENFERYKKLVTSSLFKEHFENAPKELKSFLLTQYRMHPQIMRLVNHFYEGRLECGLKDPDGKDPHSDSRERRLHGMTLRGTKGMEYVTPDRHVVWIDSSRDPLGKEHRERKGQHTSKENDLEAILIAKLLEDIDAECRRLGYGADRRKPVGVITFYGRQVQNIRQAIKRLEKIRGHGFEAIRCDVSTVDRFQGQERPIVIVSLVRNPKWRLSAKANTAQFERINVAFSRAQELLVVVGAKEAFYQYPVRLPYLDKPGETSREVYRHIIDELNREACFWDSGRIVSVADYRRLYS